MPLNKTRRELPWLYYPEFDRVIINAHNFTPGIDLLTGLQWYWDLATAGATEADQKNGLTLTKGGTVNVSSGGAPDGGDCIDVGSAAGYYSNASVARTIDTNSGFTVNIWVYSTATSATGNFVLTHSGSAATQLHWRIAARTAAAGDRVSTADAAGVVRNVSKSPAASLDAWHMFTLVDHGESLSSLYIDGALASTNSTSLGARQTTDRPFAIGAASDNVGDVARRHNGRLSMAGVWAVPFDEDQITALYNGGQGKRFAAL